MGKHKIMGYMKLKVLLFASILVFAPVFVGAEDLEQVCSDIANTKESCENLSSAECKATLEKCANYYDEQSAKIAQDLTKTQGQKNTLQYQVSSFKKKINGLEYQISQGTLTVKDLSIKISDTQDSITKTGSQIKESQEQIKSILRAIYQEDQRPSFMVLFEGSLSDFFSNIAYLESLNEKVNNLLKSTTDLKLYLENQKVKIDDEKSQIQKTIQIQSLQKQQNEINKKTQESFLKLTEAQYQEQLAQKKATDAKASEIKARIFELIGVAKAPTFEEAVNIAKYVYGVTGVRPAFLLSILQQESAIGKNVGQCYILDKTSGYAVSIKSGTQYSNGIHKTRDLPPFLAIVDELGRDPLATAISCPIPNLPGYGGAMGPAQFIPSTWNIYRSRLEAVLKKPGDPWNIKDAFLASGLYLADSGASKQTESAEYCAALSYFAGSCSASNQRKFGFYANQVISRAAQFEKDIKAIGG